MFGGPPFLLIDSPNMGTRTRRKNTKRWLRVTFLENVAGMAWLESAADCRARPGLESADSKLESPTFYPGFCFSKVGKNKKTHCRHAPIKLV